MTGGQLVFASPVLVLIGPTAIGKTALALALAKKIGCEIISVDSMQVYRQMDIGTAKPSLAERGEVAHHLIDIAEPDEQYDAARFVADAEHAMQRITAAGRIPLLTGGTGLYLRALLQGLFAGSEKEEQQQHRVLLLRRLQEEGRAALFQELTAVDPASAARLHPNDTQRLLRALEIFHATGIPWSVHLQRQERGPVRFRKLLQIGLTCERQLLSRRIEERTRQMLAQGLLAEVANLRKMGYSPALQSMQAIGYRHANQYLDGVWDQAEMARLLVRDTRRYAKRQMTWFKAMPGIRWFDREEQGAVLTDIEQWLQDATG